MQTKSDINIHYHDEEFGGRAIHPTKKESYRQLLVKLEVSLTEEQK